MVLVFLEVMEVLVLVDDVKYIQQQFEQQATLYSWFCYQMYCSEVRLCFAMLLFANIYLY
jgi:hypothetical protein